MARGLVSPVVFALGLAAALPLAAEEPPKGNSPRAADVAPPASSSAPQDPILLELRTLRERVAALEAKARENETAHAPDGESPPSSDADFGPAVVPFSDGDSSWVPGNYAPSKSVLKYGPLTGEIRADVVYHWEQANPIDDTISGSSEAFRANEIQVTQLGLGGDIYVKGAHARLMTQFGLYSQTTPRNDASPSRGQWNIDNAYRYLSEAYAGYHINYLAGINIQAGIFMSYVGLWSYYNFDNWTYQPSYVSSNTPWFFNGMRVQIFPWKNLKIEPWLVNGWQSYGKFNNGWGLGLQTKWAPTEWLVLLGNQYYGTDTLDTPQRRRLHTDDSVMVRLYDEPTADALSRIAASLTVDYGNEDGGGSNVRSNSQYFMGFMAYNRIWFYKNELAFTYGGGAIKNPGRYLVLLPPINGATAASGTPYFTERPGDDFWAWDMQWTGDWMPVEWVILRVEYCHRFASVPYFAGHGGVTPPGGNQGPPGSVVAGFTPDLRKTENRVSFALMVRF